MPFLHNDIAFKLVTHRLLESVTMAMEDPVLSLMKTRAAP